MSMTYDAYGQAQINLVESCRYICHMYEAVDLDNYMLTELQEALTEARAALEMLMEERDANTNPSK